MNIMQLTEWKKTHTRMRQERGSQMEKIVVFSWKRG